MATYDELAQGLEEGEAIRHHAPLRKGGAIGVTDERILVSKNESRFSIPHEAIEEVTVESFDWFLAVLSTAFVAFGFLSLERSLPIGFLVIVLGSASLYRTYRHRDKLRMKTTARAQPVVLYPSDPDALLDALQRVTDAYDDAR